jgi:6-phosphogluconate dehydrogenase
MKEKADIGVVGLAVMGENLILNMEGKGFTVACFNRTVEKVDAFVRGRGKGRNIIGCRSLKELAGNLSRPRKVLMMVKAGGAVDELIETIAHFLEPGDILIDGGNSHFSDTERRCRDARGKGLMFVGAGISGGEEGALKGPSIMPGGDAEAWPHIKPILQSIAAKVDDGIPCCEWLGPGSAGHFVKMVHNGIEYGDMQLIAEAYHMMSRVPGMSPSRMSSIFAEWNERELDSYLIEITSRILSFRDEESGKPLVDVILDTAGQKGTGRWTSQVGLELGVGIPQIAESVFARSLSAVKDERIAASRIYAMNPPLFTCEERQFLAHLEKAVYAAKICSYAQGFQLLAAASGEFGWDLRYSDIAQIWRNGCIIRARFLVDIRDAFKQDPDLSNLLLAPYFSSVILDAQDSWRQTVKYAVDLGIPVPAIASALNYFDSYRCERLPANLIQAQRDFFGAHRYERTDRPRGESFHTNWTGKGADNESSV